MAHFAEIDESNTVLRVVVVDNAEAPDEATGAGFCSGLFGGRWLQCSYNGNMRKQFPGEGYSYDPAADVFVAPQPFPSWTLDANHDWQPPVPKPLDETRIWIWDEAAQSWVAAA